ncbi:MULTISPECIES: glycoside hydrolase family 43 protein [unclassified Streptomyces]|uniref:glycoside hydrolase family 43 protein n=1 Tax=unclassified Streptomyces TaxID=2593676 RepID=UPI002365DD63|nr:MULTISPECIES: glycoside hydrolase family 43 protein [unclassified Streptomyces]MDF3140293.1 glycoside hydrolase family 43 protein [Streptomyces sp. T21Q-yed]WDF44120.1 glycoside hydrolase family 43 protein [Streptomyces sp. T12]
MPTFANPVLAGSHPDPSICRVGENFYLVTSSFAYYPGLPVFHSRDLVNWRPLGHVVHRPSQVSLTGLDVSDGLWAATIRHHEGTFYVVVTLARGRQGSTTFLCTASDPAGPWSDPIVLEAEGIDPSLFFDDDGRCWFTACRDAARPEETGPGELWMRELDLETLALTGPTHILWYGAMRGAWVEAPHVYKRDGVYYLIGAEGGTEHHHAVTAARSDVVTGPYTTDPRSPLLTHRHRGAAEPIHNVGHVDLVDTPAGETWAVALGVRPIDGTHTLGREVFLVPVEWTARGPVFAPDTGRVRLSERLPAGVTAAAVGPGGPVRDDFTGTVLGPEWNSLRGPVDHLVSPSPGEGGLTIRLSPEPLTSTGTPAFVARRQQHLRMRARARIRFAAAAPTQAAGLVVFQHNHHATLALTVDAFGTPHVVLTAHEAGTDTRLASVAVTDGDVVLVVDSDESGYTFHVEDRTWTTLGSIDRPFFSTERAGGFVGVHIGLYGVGEAEAGAGDAHVRWFEYAPHPGRPRTATRVGSCS